MPYLLVIRDSWEKISQKTRFVSKIFGENSNINIFYVVRKDEDRFREKWHTDKVELATSTSGILFSYLLILLKSPKDLHDRILRRLFKKELGYLLLQKALSLWFLKP